MKLNPQAIQGILSFTGFTNITVHPRILVAHAVMADERYDFWVQDGRLWLEVEDSPSRQGQLSVAIVEGEPLETTFQVLMDLYNESENEAAD